MNRTWYVYALLDPKSEAVRYIGKSVNPALRLDAHVSKSSSKAMRDWVRSLDSRPLLSILGEFPDETAALVCEQQLQRSHRRTILNGICDNHRKTLQHKARFSGFGNRVLEARKALKITQRSFAKRCGVNNGVISRIESGDRPGVTAELAVIIAKALGTTVEYLVTGKVYLQVAA